MLPSNLSAQRVFIVGDNSLFEEGLTHLLAFETDLQVSCAKYTEDLAFLDDISQNQPQVIILNESSLADPMYILDLILAIFSLARLCIIIMRLNDNIVDVYDISQNMSTRKLCERKQFILSTRDDLMAVVRG